MDENTYRIKLNNALKCLGGDRSVILEALVKVIQHYSNYANTSVNCIISTISSIETEIAPLIIRLVFTILGGGPHVSIFTTYFLESDFISVYERTYTKAKYLKNVRSLCRKDLLAFQKNQIADEITAACIEIADRIDHEVDVEERTLLVHLPIINPNQTPNVDLLNNILKPFTNKFTPKQILEERSRRWFIKNEDVNLDNNGSAIEDVLTDSAVPVYCTKCQRSIQPEFNNDLNSWVLVGVIADDLGYCHPSCYDNTDVKVEEVGDTILEFKPLLMPLPLSTECTFNNNLILSWSFPKGSKDIFLLIQSPNGNESHQETIPLPSVINAQLRYVVDVDSHYIINFFSQGKFGIFTYKKDSKNLVELAHGKGWKVFNSGYIFNSESNALYSPNGTPIPHSITSNDIFDVIVDNEKNLWILTGSSIYTIETSRSFEDVSYCTRGPATGFQMPNGCYIKYGNYEGILLWEAFKGQNRNECGLNFMSFNTMTVTSVNAINWDSNKYVQGFFVYDSSVYVLSSPPSSWLVADLCGVNLMK